MLRHFLLLLFGVMVCSTAVIMMNATHTHPIVLAAVRLLLSSIVICPILSREYRRAVRRARALQDVMLPEIDRSIVDIESRLDELEQEDAIWMRRGARA